METIIVPRNLGQLKNKLPKKKYRAQSAKAMSKPVSEGPFNVNEPSEVDKLIARIRENKENARKSMEKRVVEPVPQSYGANPNEKNEPTSATKTKKLPPVKVSKHLPPIKAPPVLVKNPSNVVANNVQSRSDR